LSEIAAVCQGYRNMIVEQNRVMIKMAADFQHQIAQLSRAFHQQLTDIEQSYRAAFGMAHVIVPPAPVAVEHGPSFRRGRLPEPPSPEYSSDEDDESTSYESDTEKKIKLWKAEGRRHRVRRQRAKHDSPD
jgi:hypothetical protein